MGPVFTDFYHRPRCPVLDCFQCLRRFEHSQRSSHLVSSRKSIDLLALHGPDPVDSALNKTTSGQIVLHVDLDRAWLVDVHHRRPSGPRELI